MTVRGSGQTAGADRAVRAGIRRGRWPDALGLLLAGCALLGGPGGAQALDAGKGEQANRVQRGKQSPLSAEDLALVKELELLEQFELLQVLDLFEPDELKAPEDAPAPKP